MAWSECLAVASRWIAGQHKLAMEASCGQRPALRTTGLWNAGLGARRALGHALHIEAGGLRCSPDSVGAAPEQDPDQS